MYWCRLDFSHESGELAREPRIEGPSARRDLRDGHPVILTGWFRLGHRRSLATLLAARAETHTDADLVLAAYLKWGTECVQHLEGDFAFALWDSRVSAVFAARDQMGVKPLFYAVTKSAITMASSAGGVASQPDVDSRFSTSWVARFVADMSPDLEATAYLGVNRLPPGSTLTAHSREVSVVSFASLDPTAADESELDPQWLTDYRNALFTAVDDRITGPAFQGIELSGGLDSTSIAACAAASDLEQAQSMHAVGFALGGDEGRRALMVSSDLGLAYSHFITGRAAYRGTGGSRRLMLDELLGFPLEVPDAGSYRPIFALCQRLGITRLHSGFGGDEGVTSNAPSVTSELRSRFGSSAALGSLRGRWPSQRLRLARASFSSRNDDPATRGKAILSGIVLRDDVIGQAGIPALLLKGQGQAPQTTNEAVIAALTDPWTSARLEQCSLVAASYGVEYTWPLLDLNLIRQYLRTPTVWKRHRGVGRYLHRCAVADILDPTIVWANKGDAEARHRAPRYPVSRPTPAERSAQLASLADSLHPALASLIDHEKLRRASSTILDPATAEAAGARLSMRTLLTLDPWFKEKDPVLA